MNAEKLENLIKQILEEIGEDPNREGLRETPKRIARMFEEIFSGYRQNLDEVINNAIFTVNYDEMILVKDIDFYSMCEHHMLPFFGVAHVAYIPNGKIIGLSKIPRIVEMFSRRLQVQERMTVDIANAINEAINPLGVAVVVEAIHLCSVMRGVKKHRAKMITSAMLGVFKEDLRTRQEFLHNIGRNFHIR
jgi:GTP cyclohydrolase I (EC 3.5.4.16)